MSAPDKQTVDTQAQRRQIKVWVYNSQNATPDVQRVNQLARAARIPITTVTETLSPASATFEQWQVAELREPRAGASPGDRAMTRSPTAPRPRRRRPGGTRRPRGVVRRRARGPIGAPDGLGACDVTIAAGGVRRDPRPERAGQDDAAATCCRASCRWPPAAHRARRAAWSAQPSDRLSAPTPPVRPEHPDPRRRSGQARVGRRPMGTADCRGAIRARSGRASRAG